MEQQMIGEKNNAAKYAFFYMLSLVALIFMALSAGIIVFQIINKNIVDVLENFRGSYNSGSLKFAISAIIIASPIYYLAAAQINKNLFSGKLGKDSGIRKWLTYFILLVSTIVMLGFLVAVIYNFLEGELSTKFILKAITAIIIAAAIFTYYLYDIRRENVVGVKDKTIRIYFYGSLVLVAAALISAFIFVESPSETRNIKYDSNIINRLSQIDSVLNTYYYDNGKLPDNLDIMLSGITYLREEDMLDPATGKKFAYKAIDKNTYELCATFKLSSKNYENINGPYYFEKRWDHEAGYQCIKQKVRSDNIAPKPIVP
jgi:hypothetical protein